jgi:small-conductance mechanosensitive channel
MKRSHYLLALTVALVFQLIFMAVFADSVLAQTDSPGAVEEATSPPPEEQPGSTSQPGESVEQEPDVTPTPTSIVSEVAEDLDDISSRELFTLEGPLSRWIADLSAEYGWNSIRFMGLSLEDWINLVLSVLIFFLIFQLGKRFLYRGLRALLRRTRVKKIEEFLGTIRSQIDWLVLIIALQLSLARLVFLGSGLRILLNQAFFIAYATTITVFLWKTIGFAADTLLKRSRTEAEIQRLSPIFIVVRRVSEALLLIIYFSIILSYFGIDITAFAAALGIGGLALSLAAQDTLADAISGFLILIDQPFRVGDRIEISGLGTWGDVVDIGTRTTRIRTRDNRLVIVPNSAIAKDQVINYTYPDPRYRVQIEVGIDYDSDLKLARQTAIEAVQKVEGVLLDKPIDALFIDFGDSTIIFRIRWWISSYIDTRRMFDRVNEALLENFKKMGIKMPNITYDLHLKVDNQAVPEFSAADSSELTEDASAQGSQQE